MELSITRQPVAINETVLDTSVEQSVECDVLLPDYCPDILRILTCQGNGAITDAEVRGDKLVLDGMTVVQVCYLGETGGVRRAEYKLPFSRTMDLKGPVNDPIVSTDVQTQYLNCRATSPRRMDIRGALMIRIKVTGAREEQAIYAAEGMGMQMRREEMKTTRLCARANRMLAVSEEIELPYGKPAATSVVSCRCCAVPAECRAMGGKVIIRGELHLHLLYEHDGEGYMESADYQLPISQIVDMPKAEEDCRCDLDLRVISCEVVLRPESEGEARRMSLEASLCACVALYEECGLSAGVDCYSTCCRSRMSSRPITISRMAAEVEERCGHKETVELPEEYDKVADLWCTPANISSRAEGNTLIIRATLVMQILAERGGMLEFTTKNLEFSHQMPCDTGGGTAEFIPRVYVLSTNFVTTGPKEIEVRCELLLGGLVMLTEQKTLITDIQLDTSEKIERDPAVGLTIYYAQRGESVWEIGKRYHVPVQAIMGDNGLDADTLEGKTALLIPIV